jgi:hypothetical protein
VADADFVILHDAETNRFRIKRERDGVMVRANFGDEASAIAYVHSVLGGSCARRKENAEDRESADALAET